MDCTMDNDAVSDAYLPSPVKRVKKSAFLKLQERWESGRALRHQNSSDSIADVLGKLTIQREGEDATEVTEAESCCSSSDDSASLTSSMSQNSSSSAKQADDDGSAINTRKTVRFAEVTIPIVATGSNQKSYTRWEFGKKKTFAWPTISKRTHRAAIAIQRVARGGMARLHFKIRKLEHLLDTRDDRTQSAIAKIAERTDRRKEEFLKQVQKQNDEAERKRRCYEALAQEQQQVVEYLRLKNRQERDKLAKYEAANQILRQQNDRMENSKKQAEGTFWSLNDHTQTIVEQHKKLTKAARQYKVNIAALQAAIQDRDAHMSTEHRIKTLYRHAVGDIAVRLEESPRAAKIAERVTTLCVALENMEATSNSMHATVASSPSPKHGKSRPPSTTALAPETPRSADPETPTQRRKSLGAFLGSEAHSRSPGNEVDNADDEEDDASLDNYTIHTMNDF